MSEGPRVGWFHCFSGIAGDMALGALLDAGADVAAVREICELLPLGGWDLHAHPTQRNGIAATDVKVITQETSVVRTASHINALIGEARLPDRVADRALAVFGALSRAEGKLHRRPPEQIHFHEVGGLDAIIDVVGTCAALEVLDIDEICSSAVACGRGMIRSAHGMLPNPPPAVVELLVGCPTFGLDVGLELTTPTGAAILSALSGGWGPMPPMTISASGFGAGDNQLQDRPNLTQVVVGTMAASRPQGQPVMLFETNVDDATGETLAHTVTSLLEAGAHDAWITPIIMKKGRPAHKVSVLCDRAVGEQVAATLSGETGSLGVRGQQLERWPQARLDHEVDVDGRRIRVKVSAGRVKVEHDEAVRASRLLGLPAREVVSLAEEAWRRRGGDQPVA
ncbi:MAG: nickel pincer cofactor biosynthesis protein LarC [bacterium]|nr:nickel pincer cofactor biosynthesis protein LarC [bacterium]MCY4272168.1 nickel pincer cofactor biosynthesis protein LarC [bacterium]